MMLVPVEVKQPVDRPKLVIPRSPATRNLLFQVEDPPQQQILRCAQDDK